MADVVGIVFSPGGKVYSFDPGGLELKWSEKVICQTARGREYGRVVKANYEIPEDELGGALKRVSRRATDEDAEIVERQKQEAKDAVKVFRELKKELGVDVSPVSAEVVFDGSRVSFAFRAEGKPKLGELQRQLASRLGTRIELKSVGPREQARLCGGHGLCGGQMCCTRFPSHEEPIGLRMAKDQDLPMSSGRITGLCGRLRCCLAFEHPTYKSFRERAPRVGARVETPQGVGVVKSYEVVKDSCVVELVGQADPRASRGVEALIDDVKEVSAEEFERLRALVPTRPQRSEPRERKERPRRRKKKAPDSKKMQGQQQKAKQKQQDGKGKGQQGQASSGVAAAGDKPRKKRRRRRRRSKPKPSDGGGSSGSGPSG